MRTALACLLMIAALAPSAYAQGTKKSNIEVVLNDEETTSQLLDIPIAASTGLTSAHIGLKYFGPQSDSDISVVLTVVGARPRYAEGQAIGAKWFAGDMPLSQSKLRVVDRITRDGVKDILVLHITPEELAWLAGETRVKIELFNVDTNEKLAGFMVVGQAMNEFNQFAKSVLLIKSHSN
jgi:hypothetical protein